MRMRLIISNLCEVDGAGHEYLRNIVDCMDAFHVKLKIRCLEDDTDLVDLVANLRNNPWNEMESDHVIGTVIILPGTYAMNSKSYMGVEPSVREAIEELKVRFTPNLKLTVE